ncbi:uncharacterized protein [Euphorbia lathyris]|uniref:uncharacterized protein n=1 Tax=Euphorbia lathyris TaxID=212925 RepID=UPI0033135244
MAFLKHAIRSPFTLAPFKPNYALSFLQSSNHFSTGVEQPPPPQDSSFQPFLRNAGSGMVYAKLFGLTKHTLKTDIITWFEGSNLTPDDIKVVYNRNFMPLGMIIQFSSGAAFDVAYKTLLKRGRLIKLERADRDVWDNIVPYEGRLAERQFDTTFDGKTVLLQGIPPNAVPEDLERFLSGCQFDPSSTVSMTQRGPMEKIALIRFSSRTEAMNAFIMKNRGYCLNGQIKMRLLQ